MRYPSLTKQNHRYRAPMESRKFIQKHTETYYDLLYLYRKLDELKEETKDHLDDIRDGREDDIQGGNDMSAELILIRKKAEAWKGGGLRG